jgi:CheY-like chemotaxis protein
MPSESSIKSKKLSEAELQQLLDELDARDNADLRRNRRGGMRFSYRKSGIKCRIEFAAGGGSNHEVVTRNLSATGVCFLHCNFVPPGTQVTVWLKRRLGGVEEAQGRVLWCTHVRGAQHQVGVRFKQPVFPQLLVDQEHFSADAAAADIDPRLVRGNVMYIEDQEVDRALFKHHLQKCPGVTVELVATGAEAMDVLGKGKTFDAICVDLNLEDHSGEEMISAILASGHRGPIVCITAEADTKRLKQVEAAGATATITKPYEARRLISVLAEQLGVVPVRKGEEIFSTHSGNAEMTELVTTFVKQVRTHAKVLRVLSKTEEMAKVRALVNSLMGAGTACGFPMITDACKDVIKSLNSTLSVVNSGSEIERLLTLCGRIMLDSEKLAA